MKTSRIAPVLALSCAVLAAPASAGSIYSVTELGTLGGVYSAANGVNNNGQATGTARIAAGTQHTAVWNNGPAVDLGSGSTVSQGRDINDSGQVVGYAGTRAMSWNGGTATQLNQLGGATLSQATGVNNSGQIVGYSNYTGAPEYHAVVWNSSSSAPTDLGTLGGTYSYAQDINNSGQIVGVAGLANGQQRATVWNGGVASDLGTLGGTASYAYGINDGGQIVGYSNLAGDPNGRRATLWNGGTLTNLGTLGGTQSEAYGINASGQVVGFSFTTGTTRNAFLWDNGVMTNLNSLIDPLSGWTLQQAESINDSGQIVGYGTYQGQTRGFLLTLLPAAVPEPATWLLMIAGFGFIGAGMRRRTATTVRYA